MTDAFSAWQWELAFLGAFLLGLSKTGIAGVGAFTIAIYADILPARQSTGIILPLLVCADVVAVAAYRRHAVWKHLWRLFPWAVPGVVAGAVAMGFINDAVMRRLIGGTLIIMTLLQLWRQQARVAETDDGNSDVPHVLWFSMTMGILAGFATMVANAAGPIFFLYLLAMRLPKMEFLGTGAWYFLILNVFKLPFSWHLQLITPDSLVFNLKMAPLVIAGALLGRIIIRWINQRWFERLTIAATVIVSLKLLL